MSYTVFARKYRPQTFDDVIGQDHITRTLRNAIEQHRLAHAYIFVGPRGTGKTSTARILAKALNCVKGPTVNPCGVCPACLEIAAGNSLDVLEFDAASNTQVDKIRELIIDNVKYLPAKGKFKMYIVDEVHMLSNSSFNALLKTLEEPPPHVKFVFATTDVRKVPTTILSRCQRFDLKRIPTALIAGHLQTIASKEGIDLAPAAADTVARGAEGGMRDAESMLDQLVAFCGNTITEADVLNVFGFTALETVTTLCDHLIVGDAPGALGVVHGEAEAGKDLTRLLADLIAHLRNLLVAQADPAGLADELSEEQVGGLAAQAARLDMARLLDLIEQFAAAEGRMKWAPNKKMHLEIAVIRAVQMLSQTTLTEVIETLAELRGGAPAAPRNASASVAAKHVPKPLPALKPIVAKAPAPAPTPLISEAPAPVPVKADRVSQDPAEIWREVISTIRAEGHSLRLWASSGELLRIDGDTAVIGFSAEQTLAAGHCEERANRAYLESLLTRFAGRPLKVAVELREGLEVKQIPQTPPAAKAAAPERDPMEEFKQDPLILKALELFKAEIST